jgi:hypothetical protein
MNSKIEEIAGKLTEESPLCCEHGSMLDLFETLMSMARAVLEEAEKLKRCSCCKDPNCRGIDYELETGYADGDDWMVWLADLRALFEPLRTQK